MSVAELLDALAHTPSLRGASCRGRSALFDVDRDDHQAIRASEGGVCVLPGARCVPPVVDQPAAAGDAVKSVLGRRPHRHPPVPSWPARPRRGRRGVTDGVETRWAAGIGEVATALGDPALPVAPPRDRAEACRCTRAAAARSRGSTPAAEAARPPSAAPPAGRWTPGQSATCIRAAAVAPAQPLAAVGSPRASGRAA